MLVITPQKQYPKISKNDVNFIGIGSENGLSGTLLGKKYGFKNSTTDIDSLINNPSSNTIFHYH